MAASGWCVVIPYHDDPNVILETARQQAFADGGYSAPVIEPEFLHEIEFFSVDEETRAELIAEFNLEPLTGPIGEVGIDGLVDWLESKYASGEFARLDELLALQCVSSSGTHSMLDIYEIAPARKGDAIYPLADSELLRLYGTTQPAKPLEFIVESDDTLYSRGEGIYFTFFEDGKPIGIYIEGASGD